MIRTSPLHEIRVGLSYMITSIKDSTYYFEAHALLYKPNQHGVWIYHYTHTLDVFGRVIVIMQCLACGLEKREVDEQDKTCSCVEVLGSRVALPGVY